MRGVAFLGDRKLQLMQFPDPTPGPHDVVVEIKASGMCGSDLRFYRASGETASLGLGKVSGPVIAGHEPCGVVAAIGSAVDQRTAKVGARVMVHHYSGCGELRALPDRLVADVRGGQHRLRRHRPWCARAIYESAGAYDRGIA